MNSTPIRTRAWMLSFLTVTIGTILLCASCQTPSVTAVVREGRLTGDGAAPSGRVPSGGPMGYRAMGVRADNDLASTSTTMLMSVDCLVLHSPADSSSRLIMAPAAKLKCSIQALQAGGRDQSAPFAPGDNVWFYWIWGGAPGLNTICSAQTPVIGPNLPAGYTHYVPAFPVVISAKASLVWPVEAPGRAGLGTTRLRVRGNKAFFLNTPAWEQKSGEYETRIDLSPLIPRAAETALLFYDAEISSPASGFTWAGLVPRVGLPEGGNYTNFSVYSQVAGQPAAQNVSLEIPLDDSRITSAIWSRITGPEPAYRFWVFVQGYSFSF